MEVSRPEDIEGYETVKGITRKELARGKNVLFTWNEIAAECVIPPHQHPEEQMSYVLKGRMEVSGGGRSIILGPGEAAWFKSNEVHSARALEESVIALDIHSPPLKKITWSARSESKKGRASNVARMKASK